MIEIVKKTIWFYTTHVIEDMKKFLIETLKKEDYKIEYNDLKKYTKKSHPKVVTKEMTRSLLCFQHKEEDTLFLLEHGIQIAKKIQDEDPNLVLTNALYENHELFKFCMDCVLSLGENAFSIRQYYNRVQTRAPLLNFEYKSNTSKQLNYILGFFLDLNLLNVVKNKNDKYYQLKSYEFLRYNRYDNIKNKIETLEDFNKIILKELDSIPDKYKLGSLIPIPKLKDKILLNYEIRNEDFEKEIYSLFINKKVNLHPNDQKVEGTIILPTGQEMFYISKIGD